MNNNTHRDSADTARADAAASELPNVRARNLRSAEAHDAVAAQEEKSASSLKARISETAARRAERPDQHDEDGSLPAD